MPGLDLAAIDEAGSITSLSEELHEKNRMIQHLEVGGVMPGWVPGWPVMMLDMVLWCYACWLWAQGWIAQPFWLWRIVQLAGQRGCCAQLVTFSLTHSAAYVAGALAEQAAAAAEADIARV